MRRVSQRLTMLRRLQAGTGLTGGVKVAFALNAEAQGNKSNRERDACTRAHFCFCRVAFDVRSGVGSRGDMPLNAGEKIFSEPNE